MRRRRAVSNSPASALRRFGSSTVARFGLIVFGFLSCRRPSFPALCLLFAELSRPSSPRFLPFQIDRFCQLEPSLCLTRWRVRGCRGISKRLATGSPPSQPSETPYLAGVRWPAAILEQSTARWKRNTLRKEETSIPREDPIPARSLTLCSLVPPVVKVFFFRLNEGDLTERN